MCVGVGVVPVSVSEVPETSLEIICNASARCSGNSLWYNNLKFQEIS